MLRYTAIQEREMLHTKIVVAADDDKNFSLAFGVMKVTGYHKVVPTEKRLHEEDVIIPMGIGGKHFYLLEVLDQLQFQSFTLSRRFH